MSSDKSKKVTLFIFKLHRKTLQFRMSNNLKKNRPGPSVLLGKEDQVDYNQTDQGKKRLF